MRSTWGTDAARAAVLGLALVNAVLFSMLLPLWEGFDEPFHYGYVEELWQTKELPVFRRTVLPFDVVASFQLAPVSSVARRAIPEAIPYDAWFALPDAERERRRRGLEQLTPDPRPPVRGNYEAHQPPLAYLLLAPLDRALARFPLTARVLALRLVCAVGAVLLMFWGASWLCRELEVPPPYATAALFGIFSSEMFYATTAHVANDWLAVGLSAFFFASLARFVRMPHRRSALVAAAWLSAGLLTKAYFLVLAIAGAAVAIARLWRKRTQIAAVLPAMLLVLVLAGPWYGRNLRLYGNAAGNPEALDGIGLRQSLAAASHIDWPAMAGYLARASLWTGNNWFNSYSRITLDALLALLAIAVACWVWRRREVRPAEWAVFATIVAFMGALAYEACSMVADRPGQAVAGPSPWYTQVLAAPVMALAFLGLSRWKRAGQVFATVTVALEAWILVASWTLKLFPMYAGGPAILRGREIWDWWTHGMTRQSHVLSLTALAPDAWLYFGLAAALAFTIAACGLTMRALRR